jgi:hypothetical protein
MMAAIQTAVPAGSPKFAARTHGSNIRIASFEMGGLR